MVVTMYERREYAKSLEAPFANPVRTVMEVYDIKNRDEVRTLLKEDTLGVISYTLIKLYHRIQSELFYEEKVTLELSNGCLLIAIVSSRTVAEFNARIEPIEVDLLQSIEHNLAAIQFIHEDPKVYKNGEQY